MRREVMDDGPPIFLTCPFPQPCLCATLGEAATSKSRVFTVLSPDFCRCSKHMFNIRSAQNTVRKMDWIYRNIPGAKVCALPQERDACTGARGFGWHVPKVLHCATARERPRVENRGVFIRGITIASLHFHRQSPHLVTKDAGCVKQEGVGAYDLGWRCAMNWIAV